MKAYDLQKCAKARSNHSLQKRLSNQTEKGKCTNVTNHRIHVDLSTPFYTNHRLFWLEFSMSCIFTDPIMQNYQSNQSALMTRCGTDLRHQYGIFGYKNHRHPSHETPLRLGVKKDSCVCRLGPLTLSNIYEILISHAMCSANCFHGLDDVSTTFQIKIKEAIHIQREQPLLNQITPC